MSRRAFGRDFLYLLMGICVVALSVGPVIYVHPIFQKAPPTAVKERTGHWVGPDNIPHGYESSYIWDDTGEECATLVRRDFDVLWSVHGSYEKEGVRHTFDKRFEHGADASMFIQNTCK